MLEINKIHQGHALDLLRQIDDGCIDTIVTSPPYWGLRDYKTEPIVWDGDTGCEHDFLYDGAYHDNMRYRAGKHTTVGNNLNPEIFTIKSPIKHKAGETNAGKESWYKDGDNLNSGYSQFCSKCGAWCGSLGLEPSFDLYIEHLLQIFAECKRVLKPTGVMWINIGDTYASGTRDKGNGYDTTRWELSKEGKNIGGWHQQPNRMMGNYPAKCLCDIPFRLSIAMIDRLGWVKRNTLIWEKPNSLPQSVKDRFSVSHEYIFMFVKSRKYWFEQQFEPLISDAERGGGKKIASLGIWGGQGLQKWKRDNSSLGRNKRSVWTIATRPLAEKHFAHFPEALIEPMIRSSCPETGIVCDPFMGAGTTAVVAKKLGRHWLGIELNPEYIKIAERRIANTHCQMEIF